MEKYDVIVVGAGNGGLAAASYASQKGLKTLILEKHNIPGGAASSFRRGRFEFEPSLHEMAEVGSEANPGATRQLFKELKAQVKLIHDNHCYRLISTDENEKYDADIPAGVEDFCKALDNIVPGCYESVKKFFDLTETATNTLNKLVAKKLKPKDFPELLNLMRMSSHSADKFMDLLKIPPKAQHILCAYWCYIGEPTTTINAFILALIIRTYVVGGAGIPTLFSHELSLAVEKTIRDNGGEIWYNTPVTKILIKKGAVYGVVANGKEYYADHVICNCFPNDVFGHMVDLKNIPLLEIKKANARKIALSFAALYIGLNKTAKELGIKDYTLFMQERADSQGQFEMSHGFGGEGLVITNCLNVINPGCTPEGTCELTFTSCVYGEEWAKIKPEEYKKKKLEIADKMINLYEKTTGISIRPYIEEIEIATPLTFSRYLNTPNGTAYGYQTSNWDGIFMRTIMLEKERTVKGLRFCGAHAEKALGYNMAYTSGIETAQKTIADIKKMRKGK